MGNSDRKPFMGVRIVTVLHQEKSGVKDLPDHLRFNPGLTDKGVCDAYALAQRLAHHLGPLGGDLAHTMWTSTLSRALGTASVIATTLGLEVATKQSLGQFANKGRDEVYYAVGHEGDGFEAWQEGGIDAFRELECAFPDGATILVVTHRPVLAGLVGIAKGINEPGPLEELCNSLDTKKDWWTFRVNGGVITLDE